MKKIIIRVLIIAMVILPVFLYAEIENKDQILNLETEILTLAKQRHEIAGKSLDLRLESLELQKTIITDNRKVVLDKLKSIRKEIKTNGDNMKNISLAISNKSKALKALLPVKKGKPGKSENLGEDSLETEVTQ